MSLARASSSLAGRTTKLLGTTMTKDELIKQRGNCCELCGSSDSVDIYKVEPKDEYILVCETCKEQLENTDKLDPDHFRCLNDSMWSEVEAVKVVAYRVLNMIKNEGWPADLLDIFYIEDDTRKWAEETLKKDNTIPTKDSNGNTLKDGDSVTIIKDLEVKGAGFTAKRGTVVKNIHLTDNPEQIEGRVNGTKIVLLSKFLKKV